MKTNRIIMTLFGLLVVFLIYKQLPSPVSLSGSYYLNSIRIISQSEWSNEQTDSLYNWNDSIPTMRILENDSLEFSPRIGAPFYGANRFHYHVTITSIVLNNGTLRLELPYKETNGSLLLLVNRDNIKTIILKKDRKPKNAPTVIGKL